jgi:asparagine synthase (glutamine-hydrolysing)
MCGFVGVVSSDQEFTKTHFNNMLDQIKSRGPDSFGIEKIDNVHLGHRRLSILDLTASGHQPMLSDDKRYSIIYNGEVYNFKELRSELEAKGFHFRSECDTEVILNLFISDGQSFINKLNGMFTILIYDSIDKNIYIYRDRFGIKPLYYGWVGDDFVVASELKSIVKHPKFKKKINKSAVESFFLYRYIPAPLSIWEGVSKLGPGKYIIYNTVKHNFVDGSYYTLEDSLTNVTKKEDIKEAFEKSIERRLVSDVEVASFLSGGVDSSLVTEFVRRKDKDIHSYSIGFEPEEYSEHKYAKKLAEDIHVKNEINIISGIEEKTVLDIFKTYDEPFADSSMFPTFLLCDYTSQKVKVALSGDGGDELFSGYSWYLNSEEIFKGNFFENIFFPHKNKHRIAKRYCDRLLGRFNLENIHYLVGESGSKEYIFEKYIKGKDVRTLQFVDFHSFMVDDILVKVDRASMAHSLEVRVPFLDHEFVEKVFSCSPQDYPVNSTNKSFMRDVFYGEIPNWVFDRSKKGFSAPVLSWLKNLSCFKDKFKLCWTVGGLKSNFLESEFYLNHPHKENIIWMIFCYEMWLREYFNE